MVSIIKPRNNVFSSPYPLEAVAETFGQIVREFQLEQRSPTYFRTKLIQYEEEPSGAENLTDSNNGSTLPYKAHLFGEPQINHYLQNRIYRETFGTEKSSENTGGISVHNMPNATFYDSLLGNPSLSSPSVESFPTGPLQVLPPERENRPPIPVPGLCALLPQQRWIERFGQSMPNEVVQSIPPAGENSLAHVSSGSDLSSSPTTYSSYESYQYKSEEFLTSDAKMGCFDVRPTCLARRMLDYGCREGRLTKLVVEPDINCGTLPEIDCSIDRRFTVLHTLKGKHSGESVGSDATDATTKPPFSYITLIVSAMSSKPSKHITLNEIYTWIMSSFAYYRKNTRR